MARPLLPEANHATHTNHDAAGRDAAERLRRRAVLSAVLRRVRRVFAAVRERPLLLWRSILRLPRPLLRRPALVRQQGLRQPLLRALGSRTRRGPGPRPATA